MITLHYLIRHESKINAKLVFTDTKYACYRISIALEVNITNIPTARRILFGYVCVCLQRETKFLYMTLLRQVRFLKRKSSLTTSFNRAVTVCSVNTIPQKCGRLNNTRSLEFFQTSVRSSEHFNFHYEPKPFFDIC